MAPHTAASVLLKSCLGRRLLGDEEDDDAAAGASIARRRKQESHYERLKTRSGLLVLVLLVLGVAAILSVGWCWVVCEK